MVTMERRALLLAAGSAIVSLSGCRTRAPARSDSTSPTPSDSIDVSLGETIDGNVTVSEVTVRQSVRRLSTPDSLDVYAPENYQLLFAEVDASGIDEAPPAFSTFSLHLDGSEYDPVGTLDGISIRTFLHDSRPYNPPWSSTPRSVGFLVFPLPIDLDPTAGWIALNVDGRRPAHWLLAGSDLDAIAPPHPDLTVESLDVPEAVSEETVALLATVRNDGGADGTLRAAVNHLGPIYATETWDVSVGARETVEAEYSISYDWGDVGEIQFAVLWPGDSRTVRVAVDDGQ